MKINPYLIARLYAIQSAYEESVDRFSATSYKAPAKPKANNWDDILKDEDEGGGGGGGTIKGLRGKDAEFAKRAMRKLTRAR